MKAGVSFKEITLLEMEDGESMKKDMLLAT
jgi:hypothetical protein